MLSCNDDYGDGDDDIVYQLRPYDNDDQDDNSTSDDDWEKKSKRNTHVTRTLSHRI